MIGRVWALRDHRVVLEDMLRVIRRAVEKAKMADLLVDLNRLRLHRVCVLR